MSQNGAYWQEEVERKQQELAREKANHKAMSEKVSALRRQHEEIIAEVNEIRANLDPDLTPEIEGTTQKITNLKSQIADMKSEDETQQAALAAVEKDYNDAIWTELGKSLGRLSGEIQTYMWLSTMKDHLTAQVTAHPELAERLSRIDLKHDAIPGRICNELQFLDEAEAS